MSKNINVKNITLTPEGIEYIKSLQNDRNYILKMTRDNIADAVCFITSILDYTSEEEKEKAIDICQELSIIRDNILALSK